MVVDDQQLHRVAHQLAARRSRCQPPVSTRPSRTAYATASSREWAPSLHSTASMWVRAVETCTPMAWAMAGVLSPRTSRPRASHSRAVRNWDGPAPAPLPRPEHLPGRGGHDDRRGLPGVLGLAGNRLGDDAQELAEGVSLQRQAAHPGGRRVVQRGRVGRRRERDEHGAGCAPGGPLDVRALHRPPRAQVDDADVGFLAAGQFGCLLQAEHAAYDVVPRRAQQGLEGVGEDPVAVADDDLHPASRRRGTRCAQAGSAELRGNVTVTAAPPMSLAPIRTVPPPRRAMAATMLQAERRLAGLPAAEPAARVRHDQHGLVLVGPYGQPDPAARPGRAARVVHEIVQDPDDHHRMGGHGGGLGHHVDQPRVSPSRTVGHVGGQQVQVGRALAARLVENVAADVSDPGGFVGYLPEPGPHGGTGIRLRGRHLRQQFDRRGRHGQVVT